MICWSLLSTDLSESAMSYIVIWCVDVNFPKIFCYIFCSIFGCSLHPHSDRWVSADPIESMCLVLSCYFL